MNLVMNSRAVTLFVMSLLISAGFSFSPITVEAETIAIDFESYTLGNIHGQDGWSKTGAFEVEVDDAPVLSGAKSLRISNAVTSGSFGDQTFTKSLADEAGETVAENGGQSGGTRQNHFEAEFKIASAVPESEQPGLIMSVSPDRGDGARMSYLRFEDKSDGIHVFFDDYQNGPGFVETDIATISRASHTIKFVMDFVDGADNDVVKIYIDGSLVKTGTSWEGYFNYGETNPTRTVDSLLFRTSGTAAPTTSGLGFLIDDITLLSSSMSAQNDSTEIDVSGNTSGGENQLGWMFNRDTTTATPFSFSTGAASNGTGSLYVAPISSTTASNKFVGELFLLKPIADIKNVSYDFKIGAPSADVEEHFYMNVYANFGVSSSTKFYDCRYNVIPTTGSLGGFTTVTFDPTQNYTVTTRGGAQASPFTCPTSPAGMNALSGGSTIRVIAINVGDTSTSDAGVSGYIDNVKVVTKDGIDTDTVVYDFEPKNVTPTANNMTVLVPVNGSKSFTLDYSDVDDFSGEAFVFTVNNPADGDLSGTAPDLTYTPDEDFYGTDSFTFWVNDGSSTSNIGTVSLITYESPDCPEGMNFVGGGVDKCMNINVFVGIPFPVALPDLIDYLDNFTSLAGLQSFLNALPEFVEVDVDFVIPTCSAGTFFPPHDACENLPVDMFDITSSAGANGSISPNGIVEVADGANQTFTITPASGYVVDDVKIDGDSVGAVTTYTFSNVGDEHTIEATFKADTSCGGCGGGGSTPTPTSGGGGGPRGGGGGGSYIPPVPQVLGATTGVCFQFTSNLSFGMNGPAVLELQKALAAKGYLTATPNGQFGPATRAAVIAFQKANGLEQVGMAGPKTRALLNVCVGTNPNQTLIDELTKKLNTLLEEIKKLLAARAQ